jgi:pilus assembly protein Flp/PilA
MTELVLSLREKFRALGRRGDEDEEGQGMVEYALILVLIAIVVIVVLIILGNQVKNVFCNISSGMGGGG